MICLIILFFLVYLGLLLFFYFLVCLGGFLVYLRSYKPLRETYYLKKNIQ
jgi:hypothetical protein